MLCNLVLKRQTLCTQYTGQGNKEQVSQDLKDRFLIFLLFTCLLKLTLRKLTQIHSKTAKKQNCTGRGGGE